MTPRDFDAPWYHGSPFVLSTLAKGSVVSPFREIAKAFAHKPTLVSMSDDFQTVKRNGSLPGYLYVIAERVRPADVEEMPGTDSTHWKTRRELRVRVGAELAVSDPPLLAEDEAAGMRRTHPQLGRGGGYYSRRSHAVPDSAKDPASDSSEPTESSSGAVS